MNPGLTILPKSAPLEQHSVVAVASNKPRCVLLAGSARGGTSWALKVLDSHPAVQGCHEPFYQRGNDEAIIALYDRIKTGRGTPQDTEFLIQLLMRARLETQKPVHRPSGKTSLRLLLG
jgi:hypothetical protein